MYVPGMENNLLSVFAMEDRGLDVSFTGGEVAVRLRGSNLSVRRVIGSREDNQYLLSGLLVKALVDSIDN